MFAVGHLAWGYTIGRALSKLLKVEVKTPLLIILSLIPDIDLLTNLTHRGPTHSLVIYILLFLPMLIKYKKAAIPYLATLAQHTLFGDFITGGAMMFWPLTSKTYGLAFSVNGGLNIALEWVGFITFLILMQKTGDLKRLLMPHPLNFLLALPVVEIVIQKPLGFSYPIPLSLIIPHLTCIGIFLSSIIIDLKQLALKTLQFHRSID